MDQMKITQLNICCSSSIPSSELTGGKCQLCKKDLTTPSIIEQSNNAIPNFTVYVGKCGHIFHTSCMDAYTTKEAMICPIDRTMWTSEKILTFRVDN